MQAKLDFDESIKEVIYLNNISQSSEENDKVYFKVIILLLCAKIEKYVKDSTGEYIDALLGMKLTKEKLPNRFLIEIIKNEISKIENDTIEKYINNERSIERSKVFSLIWDTKYKLENLQKKDFVVSISNNGTTALEDTYKKIGFPDLIKNLSDYKQTSDMFGLATSTSYPINEKINQIIKIRHEIIHDDKTPSITKNDVDLYVEITKDFVKQIDETLSQQIQVLKMEN